MGEDACGTWCSMELERWLQEACGMPTSCSVRSVSAMVSSISKLFYYCLIEEINDAEHFPPSKTAVVRTGGFGSAWDRRGHWPRFLETGTTGHSRLFPHCMSRLFPLHSCPFVILRSRSVTQSLCASAPSLPTSRYPAVLSYRMYVCILYIPYIGRCVPCTKHGVFFKTKAFAAVHGSRNTTATGAYTSPGAVETQNT
jgi:hypothetical protein